MYKFNAVMIAALVTVPLLWGCSGQQEQPAGAEASAPVAVEASASMAAETSAMAGKDVRASAVESVDAVSSASGIFYEASSLDREGLLEAIGQADGGCTIATVNVDGSPNLIVSVPGVADETHLVFGWADNVTKDNIERDKQAVIAYYIYDKTGESKQQRHRGARVVCGLEEDTAIIQELAEATGAAPGSTFLTIKEILPIG